MQPETPVRQVKVWDFPTRLFHWSLVLLILFAWVSNKLLGKTFVIHKVTGYLILALVLYRILWGFVGGDTARFTTFVRPFAAIGYLVDLVSGKARHFLGHNPLGGMMVLLLLALAGGQAVLGLFSLDDVPATIEGPFASKVAESTAELASRWHRRGFNFILIAVGLHVAANLFYTFVKKDNLIRPMLTGVKPAGAYEDLAESRPGSPVKALACLLVSIALVFGSVKLFGSGAFL